MGLLLPTALLETRGARTGRARRNGVIYFHDGERVTIVASKLGLPQHPAWFHNLRVHPDVKLGWGRVEFELSSHDAGGVTSRDVALARRITAIAAEHGARPGN